MRLYEYIIHYHNIKLAHLALYPMTDFEKLSMGHWICTLNNYKKIGNCYYIPLSPSPFKYYPDCLIQIENKQYAIQHKWLNKKVYNTLKWKQIHENYYNTSDIINISGFIEKNNWQCIILNNMSILHNPNKYFITDLTYMNDFLNNENKIKIDKSYEEFLNYYKKNLSIAKEYIIDEKNLNIHKINKTIKFKKIFNQDLYE